MRRSVYFLILVLVVCASATCVSASTDCERWFAAYRSELAHAQSLKRLAAAKRRAKIYAQRKLAGYVKPATPAVPHVPRGPRMNRPQSLRHIELACGVLPESVSDEHLVSEETPDDFVSEESPTGEEGLLPGFGGPGTLLPVDNVPTPVFSSSPPVLPGGGAPVYTPPFTTTGTGGAPTITPVPEPSTFAMLLTGLLGATGAIRRRLKS